MPRYTNLRHLSLRGTSTETTREVLESLTSWPHLESFEIDCGFAQDLEALCLRCPGLVRLRELIVYAFDFADSHMEALLRSCTQLRRLIVARSWLQRLSLPVEPLEHALTEVATGPGCPLLEQISLFGLHRFVEVHRSVVKYCPGLRYLHLSPCRQDYVGLGLPPHPQATVDIAALVQGCPQLRTLKLARCEFVSTESIVAVTRHCPQLAELDVHNCGLVGDEAFCALAQGCPRLRAVNTTFTALSPVGLTALLGVASLRRLDVTDSVSLPPPAIEVALNSHPHVVRWLKNHINLKVVCQDGNEIYFKCKHTTPLQKLMHAFCNRQGVTMNKVRFLFDGDRINDTMTPLFLEMEDGDVIDVMVEQQGFLHWGAATAPAEPASAAEGLLLDPCAATALPPSEVAAIVATAAGPHAKPGRAEVVQVCPLLAPAQCAALVAHAERGFAAVGDGAASWTLDLSPRELRVLIGDAAVARLCELGHDALRQSRPCTSHAAVPSSPAPPMRLAVRRRAAAPAERIVFHRDARRVVVHLPLSDAHEGGWLLLALGGRGEVRAAPAAPGVATAIDNAVVHGVSAVTAGVRHVLLAAFD